MLKAMTEAIQIPKILIYEEFDGHPIYRKGYRDVMLGLKTIEEIILDTNTLQFSVNFEFQKFLSRQLLDNYVISSGWLNLNHLNVTNFQTDLSIYKKGRLKNGIQYFETPPNVFIEIDLKIDKSDYFVSEIEYFHKKTEQLLQWGVEKVIWVFSSSRRVLIADNLQRWEFNSWDIPFNVIDDVEINIWELMLKNGFIVE